MKYLQLLFIYKFTKYKYIKLSWPFQLGFPRPNYTKNVLVLTQFISSKKKKKYLFIPFLKSDYVLTFNFVGFLATRNNRTGLKMPSGQISEIVKE